jgi:hypothetical protein
MIALRRAILALAAVAALLSSAAPALADTGPGGPSYHLRAWSLGAEAAWTTLPADGAVEAGVVYVDTYVTLTELGGRDDGTVFENGLLMFDQYRYMFDRRGNYRALSFISGGASDDDLDFSIDHRLTSALLAASVQLMACGYDRVGEWTDCTYGAGRLTASWSGQGDVVRTGDNSVLVTRAYTRTTRGTSSTRDAAVTASWDGSPIVGRLVSATILDSTLRDVFMCHGTETC